jgi:hypothetical protein
MLFREKNAVQVEQAELTIDQKKQAILAEGHKVISKCDLEIGRLAHAFHELGGTDQAFADEYGLERKNVNNQRSVYKRWPDFGNRFPNLRTTHGIRALSWADADAWLSEANQLSWSISEMIRRRADESNRQEFLQELQANWQLGERAIGLHQQGKSDSDIGAEIGKVAWFANDVRRVVGRYGDFENVRKQWPVIIDWDYFKSAVFWADVDGDFDALNKVQSQGLSVIQMIDYLDENYSERAKQADDERMSNEEKTEEELFEAGRYLVQRSRQRQRAFLARVYKWIDEKEGRTEEEFEKLYNIDLTECFEDLRYAHPEYFRKPTGVVLEPAP